MLKEIHEQADAVAETLAGRLREDAVDLGDIGLADDFLRSVRRIITPLVPASSGSIVTS